VRALITGGSSGIGKHLAGALLARGAEVVIVAEEPVRLAQAAADLRRISPRVEALSCDVGDPAAVEAMVAAVLSGGCPDVLVNCAGFAVYRTFEQSPAAEIERLVEVNLMGALRCIHGLLPAMIARGSGHLVNVASVAGLLPITPCAAYGAAKHGLVGISETLRWELQDLGVQVHLICPGRVETAFFDHQTFRQRDHRPETERTIPIEAVSAAILSAIERDRFLTVLPRSLALAVWARRALPWLVDPLLGRLLRARVRAVRAQAARAAADGSQGDA
jgi:short-subunit dehydrogenase